MSEKQAHTEDHPSPHRLWRHRRWMAWYGVIGASLSALVFLLITACGLIPPETAEAVRPVIQTAIWAHLVLPVIYQLGASGVDAVARLRSGG